MYFPTTHRDTLNLGMRESRWFICDKCHNVQSIFKTLLIVIFSHISSFIYNFSHLKKLHYIKIRFDITIFVWYIWVGWISYVSYQWNDPILSDGYFSLSTHFLRILSMISVQFWMWILCKKVVFSSSGKVFRCSNEPQLR